MAKTMDFIEEHSGEHWVSLSVSEFLSIGRIYADATLHKLVSFMLTSYLTQVKVYASKYRVAHLLRERFMLTSNSKFRHWPSWPGLPSC